MKHVKDRHPHLSRLDRKGPPKALLAKIRRLRRPRRPTRDDPSLSNVYRDVLRNYLALVSSGATPGTRWRQVVREALTFMGGQADRHTSSLAEYDHCLYGPYLGVSDEGGAALAIRRAAFATPKVRALGHRISPLTVGVALDAERLGSVGEVPVGPDEYADVWSECVGRLLITTNVGSRANLRVYNREPLVTIPAGEGSQALKTAQAGLAAAFKPFLEAPGGGRPVVVFVEFEFGSIPPLRDQQAVLRSVVKYVRTSGIAAPRIHQIGLNVRIGWGPKGRDSALRAIDLANSVGINHVSIDGVVRKDADTVVSLPGLLNYLTPELVAPILQRAQTKRVEVRPINVTDPDTVAREIWTGLSMARAMGLDLGKYGLFPLSLEEGDNIVGQVQRWFPDWCAAPVFYIDQGIISRSHVYTGNEIAKGVVAWLRAMARHKVRIVLIDTVDKSKGWRILKMDNDPKGILEAEQIARLNAVGQKLGIKMLWAGGITPEHAHQFGKLGVFGIYVTTAASKAAPVRGTYMNDPELAAEKRPTFAGVVKVKTLLEAGFLLERLGSVSPQIHAKIKEAGVDPVALSSILPRAWRLWWGRKARV